MREAPDVSRGLHHVRRTLRRASSESTALRFRGNEPPGKPRGDQRGSQRLPCPPRAGTKDGRPHKMVRAGLDRRHTPAVAGDLCGPVGPVDLDTPQGRRTCRRELEEKGTAAHLRRQGCRIQVPRRGTEKRRGRRPLLFLERTEKRSFLLWHGGTLEAGTGTFYREPGRASTGLSRLRIYRDRGKGPGACFFLGKIRYG